MIEMFFKELVIPEGVKVELVDNKVKISGPKGDLERKLDFRENIKIEKMENKIKVSSETERRKTKALVGAITAHIRNMIDGVIKGYIYKLKVVYSHFPITVKVDKDKVVIQNFLGERTPRIAQIVGKSQVKVEGQEITVSGIDLDEVSQTAANIEQATRITGYDRKVFQDGCYIVSRE